MIHQHEVRIWGFEKNWTGSGVKGRKWQGKEEEEKECARKRQKEDKGKGMHGGRNTWTPTDAPNHEFPDTDRDVVVSNTAFTSFQNFLLPTVTKFNLPSPGG